MVEPFRSPVKFNKIQGSRSAFLHDVLCYCLDEEIDVLLQVAILSIGEYASSASDR